MQGGRCRGDCKEDGVMTASPAAVAAFVGIAAALTLLWPTKVEDSRLMQGSEPEPGGYRGQIHGIVDSER